MVEAKSLWEEPLVDRQPQHEAFRDREQIHEVVIKATRLLSAAAAIWCLGISLVVWFSPVTWTGYEGTASGAVSDRVALYRVESFRQSAGPVGVFILALLCLLAVGAFVGVLQGRRILCTVCSTTLLALSVVTSFSVGSRFIPAAVVLFLVSFVGWRASPTRLRSGAG
jgi:hypothetical protein